MPRRRTAQSGSGPATRGRRLTPSSVKAWILGIGALAAAVTAVLGLVFLVFPSAKPSECVGKTTADFAGAEVASLGPREFEVLYTVETHGYEGSPLRVVWSLLRRDGSGTYRPVPGFVDLAAATLVPGSCDSDQGGSDIPVPVVDSGGYRVMLELYPPGEAARITYRRLDFEAA